jgi:flagellar biosynthesis protein
MKPVLIRKAIPEKLMSKSSSKYPKGAVALGYKPDKDQAPKLIAKGLGDLAQRIIDIAKKNHIYVQEDPLLFDSLYKLQVGEEVPMKLYKVIAEILAFVFKINKKFKRGYL